MDDDRRKKLIELGAENLADALLDLEKRDDAVLDKVERMISTPEQNIKRFKSKLSGLKRMRRFVSYGESSGFARDLEMMLEDIKAGVKDPKVGVELIVSFYKTDEAVFGSCDDSNGSISYVYRISARDLFVEYASKCPDKQWLADLVLELNEKDSYGVRDALVDCASLYLPGAVIRKTAEGLWAPAENETDEYLKRHWLLLIQSMARQLKDPKMFEKARLACWPTLSVASCVDIAGAYLESGDAQTALNWLQKIPSSEQFQADQRDVLLFEAYEKLGDRKNQEQTGWRIFRRYRSENTLAVLLSVIGVGQKEGVIKDEAKIIIQSEKLSYSDAAFLIQAGCLDEAEAYLMERRDQVDGDFYQLLLPLADSLEKCGRLLAASLLYRKLLESILKRAKSKYYTHGVRYLKKLEALADKIPDWRDVKPHPDYFQELKTDHGRKPSFWAKYQK